jgi:hypothetical protein
LGLRNFRIGMRLMVVFTTIMLLFGGVLGVLAAQGSMADIWFASAAVAAVLVSYLLVWRLAPNVIDMQGNTLAHGDNSKLFGRQLIDLKDASGKPFIREFVDLANAKGNGWVDYQWANPVTGVLEEKTTYVQRVDDIVIGCGIYKG